MQRIETLDIAKGLGIILVVIGHFMSMASYPGKVIYSFHMPLFFFISGVCFNKQKYYTIQLFLENRFRTLLWPCFIFTIIISLLQTWLLDIPLSQLQRGLPGALWFPPILFFAEIIYFPLASYERRLKILVLFSAYCLCMSNLHIIYDLPYKVSFLPKAIFYYGLGHTLKHIIQNRIEKQKTCPSITTLKKALGLMLIVVLLTLIDAKESTALGIGVKLLAALIGIYSMLLFSSMRIKTLRSLVLYLGNNTLVIMAVHVFFIRLCVYYLQPKLENHLIYKISEFILVWFICLLTVQLVNKYAVWIKRI